MAKKILDAKQFKKNLTAMVDTLSERAEAFERFVVSEIAEAAHEQIVSRAPQDKDLPGDYKHALEVVKVDGRDASYAIVYRGNPVVVSDYDPEKTVLYIQFNGSKGDPKVRELFAALMRFQPFTMDTMPLDVPRDTGFVVARVVTKAEVTLVRKRVNQQKNAIVRVVSTKGDGVTSAKAFNHNTALLYSDLAFQVLRKELGIGLAKKPHWRPALLNVRSDASLIKNMMMSDESLRLWNDPSFQGFLKMGILKTTVSESSVEDLDDFQEKIIPKV